MTPDEMRLHLMDKGATKPAIPKHERKANLDKFLQPSAEKGVMYHATMHDFNKFRNNHRGMHFVTPDIGFANNHLHGQQDHDDPLDSGENIMPVHVQVTNPFDYAKLSHVKNLFRQAKKQKPTLSMGQRRGVLGGSWSILEHPDIVKAVKRLGHDAMYVSEESGEGDGLDSKNLGVFDPRKIKSAIGNRGTYDPKEDDITKADGGAINAEPLGEDTVKWTSPLADTVNSHKLGSMSGEQWMKWLHANAPKSAKKEALASGTLDWLPQQGKVSKSAIIEHMKANAPQIKTTKFGANNNPELQGRYDDLHDRAWTSKLTTAEREEMQELERKLEKTNPSQFEEFQLPGGDNYREMTLSARGPTFESDGNNYIVPGPHTYGITEADVNRILHMRMNDRPHKGGKALNLEELQSDWAQRGRSEGFQKPAKPISVETYDRVNHLEAEARRRQITDAEIDELINLKRLLPTKADKGLPAGPYVQNTEDWTRLGLHNAIKEAAEKGHHAVTWTGGDAQAKRWSNEGLKHYYDTVMPSVTNDILKRMGVKERVGKFNLGTGSDHHGFHMTPEIVAHIKKHGLPRFASGGDIKKMRDYIANAHGKYEGHRFERASDEVPHLLESYDPNAVKKLFGSGDVARALMTMNPADFEKYSKQLPDQNSVHAMASVHRGHTSESDPHRFKGTREEYLAHLHNIKKFSSIPYLGVDKGKQGSTESTPWISEHEGRHRNRVLANRGHKTSLVEFVPRATLREPFEPVYRDEYINDIKKEMALMNNRVRPQEMTDQNGNNVRRKIIQLPELFKSGGMAHMATGGRSVEALDRESDEVPIEKRLRDITDKIHLNGSGSKDAYGTGVGGRLTFDLPISKSVTLHPYLEGSAYKPNNQPTSSSINGAGISLTKRFAEGGKAKFLKPSVEKDRWYHGSNRNIRSFKSINRHGHLGKPDRPNIHFVSASPDVANQFAMRGHQHPQFGEPIELNDKDYMEGMDHRSGANVMPVHIQVTNPFDIDDRKHLEAITNHLTKKYAQDPDDSEEAVNLLNKAHRNGKDNEDNYAQLEHHSVQQAIKDMGHDSFYTTELGHKNLGIFDPRKIKSAIGNRGTYDTNEHDITKSQGGLAHAFAEGGPVDVPKNIWKEYLKVKNVEKDNADEGHDNQWQKMRNTKSFKRLDNAIKAHIGGNARQQLEYHWKLQDHYDKAQGQ